MHIPPYGPASRENHEPERPRKLLAHRRELDRLAAKVAERGLTLVPTRIYFKGSHAKVEIALARGKDLYDKRNTIRERESKRDMERPCAKSALGRAWSSGARTQGAWRAVHASDRGQSIREALTLV